MLLKIQKSSLLMSVVFVLLWMPTLIIKYPAINSVISPLRNVMLIGFAALFFIKKKKVNRYNRYLLLFTIIYIVITASLGGDYRYAINASYKIVFSCIALQLFVDKNSTQAFTVVKNVLGFLTLCNVATLLLFPYGAYVTVNVVNDWYSSKSARWLFGPKNNMIMWIIAQMS